MNQQQKTLARYYAILDQTQSSWKSTTEATEDGTKAIGDLSKTIENPQNQLRILQSRLQELQRYWGLAFMPIVEFVIPVLNSLAKILISVAQMFGTFMAKLFGKGDSYKDLIGDFDIGGGADFGDISSELEDSASSSDDLSSGLDDSSKKAKELKKQLMGIDEINNLTTPTDSSTSGSGSGGGGGNAGYTPNLEWDDLWKTADPDPYIEELTEKIQNALKPIADLIMTIFNSLGIAIQGIANIFTSAWDNGGKYFFGQCYNFTISLTKLLSALLTNVLDPILIFFRDRIAPVVGEVLGVILGLGGTILESVSELMDSITESINNSDSIEEAVRGILNNILSFFIDFPNDILDYINSVDWQKIAKDIGTLFIDGLGATLGGIAGVFNGIFNFIKELDFKKIAKDIGQLLSKALKTIFDTGGDILKGLKEAVDGIDWKAIFDGAGELILNAIGATLWALLGLSNFFIDILGSIDWVGVFTSVGEFILEGLELALTVIVDFFVGLFQSVIDAIKNLLGIHSPSTIFQDIGENILLGIQNGISALVDWIVGIFQKAWDGVVAIWDKVSDWFDDNVIQPVKDFFTELWNDITDFAKNSWEQIKQAWTNVSTWFNDTVIKPIKTFFSDMWENIKNFAINSWNGIVNIWTTVKDWFNTNVITPIGNFFSNMWTNIKTTASNAWTGITNVFTGAKNWFQTKVLDPIKKVFTDTWNGIKSTISSIWDKILNLFSSGGKIFSGVVDGVSNVFKTIVNTLIGGINKVIATPFNTINSLLNGIRNTEILGFKPFEGLWSKNPLPVPKIPKLASGGLAYEETLAIIGEYSGAKSNPEVVAPLNDLRGMMKETIVEVINDNQKSDVSKVNDGDKLVHVSVNINSRTIYEEVVKEDKQVKRSTGKSGFAY